MNLMFYNVTIGVPNIHTPLGGGTRNRRRIDTNN